MRRPQSTLGMRSRAILLTILGVLTSLSSGCSGVAPITPVSGRVTLNGQPLTKGHVTFHPNKDKGNTFGGVCVGEINAQGEYKLQTNGKPGAPVGWYKVTVDATETTRDNTKPPTQSLVPRRYTVHDITPLEKEVVADASPGAYDIKIEP